MEPASASGSMLSLPVYHFTCSMKEDKISQLILKLQDLWLNSV